MQDVGEITVSDETPGEKFRLKNTLVTRYAPNGSIEKFRKNSGDDGIGTT